MAASVRWFQEDGHTYDLARWDGSEWVTIAEDITSPYVDDGSILDKYHVRDHLGSPWGPPFYGLDADASTCLVYGYVKLPDGEAKESATIQVRCKNRKWFAANASISFVDYVDIETNSDGYWEQELPIGMPLFVRIPDAEDWAEIIVPDLPSASLASLL